MSKMSSDDDRNDQHRFRGGARRVQTPTQSKRRRTEDEVEARINRAALQASARKGLVLIPFAIVICVAVAMVVVYVFAILEMPNKGFWEAVLPNLGWILPVGVLGGLVWSVSYFLRGGIAMSREATMILQNFFPWRGQDKNLRKGP